MDKALKKYLAERGATPLDPNLLQAHATKMTKDVIPQIVDDIRKHEQLVAELRFSPSATSRSKK